MVQISDAATAVPLHSSKQSLWPSAEMAERMAFTDQNVTACGVFVDGDANEQNDPSNCGKLNSAPAHFDAGLMRVTQERGTYHYISTRNNNFSNRGQRGAIVVAGFTKKEIVLLVAGMASAAVTITGVGTYLVTRGPTRPYMGPCNAVAAAFGRLQRPRRATRSTRSGGDHSPLPTSAPPPLPARPPPGAFDQL